MSERHIEGAQSLERINEITGLLLTKDLKKIANAVDGNNIAEHRHVLGNELLTPEQCSILYFKLKDPQDRIAILKHPAFPGETLQECVRYEDVPEVLNTISDSEKASMMVATIAKLAAYKYSQTDIRFGF